MGKAEPYADAKSLQASINLLRKQLVIKMVSKLNWMHCLSTLQSFRRCAWVRQSHMRNAKLGAKRKSRGSRKLCRSWKVKPLCCSAMQGAPFAANIRTHDLLRTLLIRSYRYTVQLR